MSFKRRTLIRTALAAASSVIVLNAGAARAEWPEKAVTVIVAWAAGGGTDATARAVAEGLQKKFGQPFNVVNRTGGGGLVGHSALAQAAPDGYTLGVITIETAMYEAQGLKGVTPADLDFIGRFNADAIAVNIRADAPYSDLKGLLEAVKADPGGVAASGANRGGLSHLAWVGLLQKVGVDPVAANWVASDGSAPALQQLASGAIAVVSTSPAEAKALVEADQAKSIALISSERSPLYPDLPTSDEVLGISWSPLPFRGLAGPKGLPEDVVQKVSAALKEITEEAEFKTFMTSRGFSVAYQDAPTFAATVTAAHQGLSETMKAVGLAK